MFNGFFFFNNNYKILIKADLTPLWTMALFKQSNCVFEVKMRKTKGIKIFKCLPMSMKKMTTIKDAATEAKINNHSIT